MNFLLQNLELALSESHLIVGEKLLEEGRVQSLVESERNLWVARVDGLEVEMQISPSRVKACSCECNIFAAEKMCGHIAAGLLALRRVISERKSNRKSRPDQKSSYSKLTVNSILQHVDREDLVAFIRHFARRNRQFSIALKTRFAGAVPMADAVEKYRQVLDGVVNAARKKNDQISTQGVNQLVLTMEDLSGQAQDAVSLEHYQEGWSIIQAVLEKIPPLLRRIETDESPVTGALNEFFGQLDSMLQEPLPPALREEIWSFLIGECTKPIYRLHDLAGPLYDILLQLADDPARVDKLFSTIDTEWKKRKLLSESHQRKLLYVKLKILDKPGMRKKATAYYRSLTDEPHELLFTIETAMENGLYDTARSLAQKGLTVSEHPPYQLRLKKVLLDIAIFEKDSKAVSELASHIYLATKDLKYLRLGKSHFHGDWDRYIRRIIEAVKAEKRDDLNTLADIYAEEKMITELSGLVREKNSLDFLKSYDRIYLAENEQQELIRLYELLLDDYLSTHFGIKPSQQLLQLLNHLHRSGAADVAGKLADFVNKHYPKRMKMALELMAG